MSPTTTLPIAEAMSASDIASACKEISAAIGGRAETWISVGAEYSGGNIVVFIHPYGKTSGKTETVREKTFPQAFSAAMDWAKSHKQVRRNAIVRSMALAIIELTDEHGKCEEARLRAKDFSRDEITEFHEAACQRAGEMCSNKPFAVLMEAV